MSYRDFERICHENGTNASKVANGAKVSKSTLSAWKQNLYEPKIGTLSKIADYLGCSVDLLLRKDIEEVDAPLSDTARKQIEREMLHSKLRIETGVELFNAFANLLQKEGKRMVWLDDAEADFIIEVLGDEKLELLVETCKHSSEDQLRRILKYAELVNRNEI